MTAESTTRAIVKERSMGRCERCGEEGIHMHHRKNRSQGGQWSPANIVNLCLECHTWVGLNPVAAQTVGLHLRHREEPAKVAILTGNVPFLLDDEGNYVALRDSDVLEPLPGVWRETQY